MKPRLSVVMSCYNAEKFLRESVDSILSQTYKDFEFIIWNDGSTDKTEEIIKSYNDPRIRYYYHENTGLGMALRMACEYARGEYIARMDADDISMPSRFEKEVSFLDNHSHVILVSTAVYYIDDNGNVIGESFPYATSKAIRKCFKFGSCIIHPACMMRRNAYLQAGGYINLKRAQDTLLFSRMLHFGDFINLPEPLLKYRISEFSISTMASYNPYNDIIDAIRKKMVLDEVINEADITIYNQIVMLSKELCKTQSKQINDKRISQSVSTLEFRSYSILSVLIGEKYSRKFICFLKNMYAEMKL